MAGRSPYLEFYRGSYCDMRGLSGWLPSTLPRQSFRHVVGCHDMPSYIVASRAIARAIALDMPRNNQIMYVPHGPAEQQKDSRIEIRTNNKLSVPHVDSDLLSMARTQNDDGRKSLLSM